MVKDKEEKVQEAKIKVVTLGEYIGKVGNEVAGQDKVKAAIALLYTENKVIAREDRKGETYYIVEK